MKTKLENLNEARRLWEILGNTPVNEDEELDADMCDGDEVIWEKGSDVQEIWMWFETHYDVSVACDLMGLPRRRSKADLDELKERWCNDPSWHIEDTEGFGYHYTELFHFHVDMAQKWEEEGDTKKAERLYNSRRNARTS